MVCKYNTVFFIMQARRTVPAMPECHCVLLFRKVDEIRNKGHFSGQNMFKIRRDACIHITFTGDMNSLIRKAPEHGAGLRLRVSHFRPALDRGIGVAKCRINFFQGKIQPAVVFKVSGRHERSVPERHDMLFLLCHLLFRYLFHLIKQDFKIRLLQTDSERLPQEYFIGRAVVKSGRPIAEQAERRSPERVYCRIGADNLPDFICGFCVITVAVHDIVRRLQAAQTCSVHRSAAQSVCVHSFIAVPCVLFRRPENNRNPQLLINSAADVISGEGADYLYNEIHRAFPEDFDGLQKLCLTSDNLFKDAYLGISEIFSAPVSIEPESFFRKLSRPPSGAGCDNTNVKFVFHRLLPPEAPVTSARSPVSNAAENRR